MANLSLQRFDKDGIELIIDTQTGEVFYPGYNAVARVASLGLIKPIDATQAKRTIESALGTMTDIGLQEAEILTGQGLRTVSLIPRKLGTQVIKRYNQKLYDEMAEAGHVVFLHKLAGYEITSTAVKPDFKIPQTYAEALLEAGRLALENERLSAKIEQDAPLVEFANEIKASDDAIDFNTFAKMIGTGRTRLFRLMRDCGVILKDSTLPYQKWVDAGYFEVTQEILTSNGKLIPFAMVTGKGQLWLRDRIKKHLEIQKSFNQQQSLFVCH
jgi:phage antirepressor YoqD-like protein